MKKLAFITAVLMGIAPIADAQPYRGDAYDHHDVVRQGDLVPLAAMDIHRKETVDVGRYAGGFRGLRLQAQRGAAYVDFVEVRFGNGEQEHYDVRRRIGRDEIVDVPFNSAHRNIAAITVHGQPDHWSRIQVFGRR